MPKRTFNFFAVNSITNTLSLMLVKDRWEPTKQENKGPDFPVVMELWSGMWFNSVKLLRQTLYSAAPRQSHRP